MILNRPKTSDELVTMFSHDTFQYRGGSRGHVVTPVFGACLGHGFVGGVSVEILWGRRTAISGWAVEWNKGLSETK